MTQTSHLTSGSITNLDATPAVANVAGQGAAGYQKSINDYTTAVAADAVGSTYKFVRIPSNACVKAVWFESEAQGAGKVQLGLYYSDSTIDGTSQANQGVVINVNFFSDDIDCTSAVAKVEKTGANSYTLDKRNQEIWKAAGLSSDPGGYFDVVATVHTTAITTGTGKLGVQVDFI